MRLSELINELTELEESIGDVKVFVFSHYADKELLGEEIQPLCTPNIRKMEHWQSVDDDNIKRVSCVVIE